eukprot:scaffold17399_cov122-Isochrysis_galbana.AAC.2
MDHNICHRHSRRPALKFRPLRGRTRPFTAHIPARHPWFDQVLAMGPRVERQEAVGFEGDRLIWQPRFIVLGVKKLDDSRRTTQDSYLSFPALAVVLVAPLVRPEAGGHEHMPASMQ